MKQDELKIPDQVFELLMTRFDTLEDLLKTHIKQAEPIHKTVEKHSVYWNLVFLGVPGALGWVWVKLGGNK